jgi:SAM-dependent MidA family methyltransferase
VKFNFSGFFLSGLLGRTSKLRADALSLCFTSCQPMLVQPIMNATPPWPWESEEALRFDRFMDLALHHPERGYYARRIRGVGASGDFTTAPMISGLLAQGIAAWAAASLATSGCRDLIEIGPGEGTLAAAVLKALPWHHRWRTRLHLVETSRPLREKQQSQLGTRAVWHDSLDAALQACAGKACLYSNELIDAFPVRRFRLEVCGIRELFLTPGAVPAEQWRPAGELPDSVQFTHPHRPGQILEVHESVQHWLAHWMPHWRKGAMLTIDYGAETAGLYHRRPGGSLRGYHLQQRLVGHAVYQNPGRQDLTADVDFTDLSHWLHQLSAGKSTLASQRDFLLPFVRANHPADAALIDPDGAGSAFRVLEFRK